MKRRTEGGILPFPGLAIAVLWAAALLAAGCAALGPPGKAEPGGCSVSGVRVIENSRSAPGLTVGHGWSVDAASEVRDRIRRGDCRFKAWMSGRRAGHAYLPGVSPPQGARLGRTGTIEVEVVDDADLFPVERDPYSSRARLAAEYDGMARFNGSLFRELDRLGRIAP